LYALPVNAASLNSSSLPSDRFNFPFSPTICSPESFNLSPRKSPLGSWREYSLTPPWGGYSLWSLAINVGAGFFFVGHRLFFGPPFRLDPFLRRTDIVPFSLSLLQLRATGPLTGECCLFSKPVTLSPPFLTGRGFWFLRGEVRRTPRKSVALIFFSARRSRGSVLMRHYSFFLPGLYKGPSPRRAPLPSQLPRPSRRSFTVSPYAGFVRRGRRGLLRHGQHPLAFDRPSPSRGLSPLIVDRVRLRYLSPF